VTELIFVSAALRKQQHKPHHVCSTVTVILHQSRSAGRL